MRLLKAAGNDSYELESFTDDVPPYAILSHTWAQKNSEGVVFSDIENGQAAAKPGFKKLQFCSSQAKRDDLTYCWIDTCCINKSDEEELSISLNSMFSWYSRAVRCYVYLSDVSFTGPASAAQEGEPAWLPAFRS